LQGRHQGDVAMTILLQLEDLKTRFRVRKGYIHAVNGVSFHIAKGETLGIVGESGCGKSVTVLSLLRLLPPAAEIESGKAIFEGDDLLTMTSRQLRRVRGRRIGMVFQDPTTSLNPFLDIGTQLTEPLIYHSDLSRSAALDRSAELLNMVGVSDGARRLRAYPHQLSGGMRQRVMLAMALACKPELVIADEPTTALDVTIQAQIVDLVKKLRAELLTSMIWISHDLAVIAGVADRVLVMYAGYVVEQASVDDLYEDPRHPYTLGLIHALPSVVDSGRRRLETIGGTPPDLTLRPAFCPFLPRCPYAIERCRYENPTLQPVQGGAKVHQIACWVDVREERS
jgi:oligopeptide/dipeptide ABC transporter ATP-binding protein